VCACEERTEEERRGEERGGEGTGGEETIVNSVAETRGHVAPAGWTKRLEAHSLSGSYVAQLYFLMLHSIKYSYCL
jgi:hypothetical protein